MDLTEKHCVPCEGGTLPLPPEAVAEFMGKLVGRKNVDNLQLFKEIKFKDFKEAMVFINHVAVIAEAEQHHPDIYIFYETVRLELSTHAIHGLSENDFILAAKIDKTD